MHLRLVAILAATFTASWAICAAPVTQPAGARPLSDLDSFNLIVGTQTIGSRYQFTSDPMLVETAKAILDMGSNTIKFNMSPRYAGPQGNVPKPDPSIKTLTDLASREPAHRQVLDMPFACYLIWAYPFSDTSWRNGLSKQHADREYKELYDFACHLLRTYNGSGKTFLLGHWEGDWLLHGNYDPKSPIPPAAIQGMIDWLNVRQRAVDDAKRDTPHHRVQVYNYTEANLVQIAIKGQPSLTNDVLPKTNVDMVSYSSYDSLSGDIRANLIKALNHIESKLPPKPGVGINGKRVFIGEYGFPAKNHSPQKQADLSRQVMRAGIEWGCPFVLYWEMYCNEVENGKPRGFWMIDNTGAKQPVYLLHQKFYEQSRKFAGQFRADNGRLPNSDEYRRFALKALDTP